MQTSLAPNLRSALCFVYEISEASLQTRKFDQNQQLRSVLKTNGALKSKPSYVFSMRHARHHWTNAQVKPRRTVTHHAESKWCWKTGNCLMCCLRETLGILEHAQVRSPPTPTNHDESKWCSNKKRYVRCFSMRNAKRPWTTRNFDHNSFLRITLKASGALNDEQSNVSSMRYAGHPWKTRKRDRDELFWTIMRTSGPLKNRNMLFLYDICESSLQNANVRPRLTVANHAASRWCSKSRTVLCSIYEICEASLKSEQVRPQQTITNHVENK